MARWWYAGSVLLGVPGLLLQSYGIVEGSVMLALAGSAMLVGGLALHLKTKGHHPIWGLWGIVPVLGAILVLLQPRKPSMTREATLDHLLIGEDPHIHYLSAPPTDIVIGRWIPMLVMVPVGLGIVLLCGWLVRVVSPGTSSAVAELPVAQETRPEPARAAGTTSPQENPAPAPEAEARAPVPEPKEGPASSTAAKEQLSAHPEAASAHEEKPSGERAAAVESSVERFKKIRKGMTYEQVCGILGRESLPVSGTMAGDKIVKWENADKSFFAARFHDNVLDRCTNLNFPPPRKELPEMAVELEKPEEKAALARKAARPRPEEADQKPAIAPEESQDGPTAGEQPEAGSESADQNGTAPSEASEAEESSEGSSAETKHVVRIGAENKPRTRPKKVRLPKYSQAISSGTHDVYLHNENPFPIKVGLRTPTKRGKNVTIPPGGVTTVFLPNGQYSVYYLNSEEPESLYNLGSLPVDSPLDSLHVQIR